MSGLREAAMRRGHGHEPGFHWRGREVSRLEGLSDAVFAFAITLLVVSLEVPRDVHEMVDGMRGFVGFIFSFFLIYRLWVTQYKFFRRYGLEDAVTIRLNGLLLFMVLFFVYPLKFLTNTISRWMLAHQLREFRPHAFVSTLGDPDVQALILFYFWGSAAVMLTFAFMYRHAYNRRHALELTPHEVHRTEEAFHRLFIGAGFGLVGPIGLLTMVSSRYKTAGSVFEYVVVAGLFLAALRLRRRAKSRPSADELYQAPEVAAAPNES